MQRHEPVQHVVLIPAYRPSAGLVDLVSDLSARGMPAIILVDVGTGLHEHPGALVLGSRTFDAAVPLRSRFGNLLTRKLTATLIGARLQDTQTGLRGIPASLAARLLPIDARGY